MITTEESLVTAWTNWNNAMTAALDRLKETVPDFEEYRLEDQKRILLSVGATDERLYDLLAEALEWAECLEGHGRPSPIPPGNDEPFVTVAEARTGLPWNATTNGFRRWLHRELAALGHGIYDAEYDRFEAPRDPEGYGKMLDALSGLLEGLDAAGGVLDD